MARNLSVFLVVVTLSGASAARDQIHLQDQMESNSSVCQKCPVLDCEVHDEESPDEFWYSLRPMDNGPIQKKTASTKYYKLNIQGQLEVTVVLDMLHDEAAEGGGYAKAAPTGNCFSFATHQNKFQIPGDRNKKLFKGKKDRYGRMDGMSPLDTTNTNCGLQDECLGVAMTEREGAYFLGNPLQEGGGIHRVTLPIPNALTGRNLGDDPEEAYYLIAAFMSPGTDYHFWGLFRDVGWACVPSKAGSAGGLQRLHDPIRALDPKTGKDKWSIQKQCPGSKKDGEDKVFGDMNRKGKYNQNLENVGYYLVPCKSRKLC